MKKIITIGGGTGSYNLLIGLKQYVKPTAIVSMMDSGGSSGKLMDEYGVLPAGDITRCILALSKESDFMKEFFNYREGNGSFKGHTVRNYLFTSLYNFVKSKQESGHYESILKEIHTWFKVEGKVCPVTHDSSHLICELEDGTLVRGETNIDIPKHNPNLKIRRLYLEPKAFANINALEEIENADAIIIGPGDLYTSVLPNLLVHGIKDAIIKSKAKKIYVCNLMTKYGETNQFKVSDFVKELENYLGKGIIDYVICNNNKPNEIILEKYRAENKEFVEPNLDGNNIIKKDLLNENDILRHNPNKLAKVIMDLIWT